MKATTTKGSCVANSSNCSFISFCILIHCRVSLFAVNIKPDCDNKKHSLVRERMCLIKKEHHKETV